MIRLKSLYLLFLLTNQNTLLAYDQNHYAYFPLDFNTEKQNSVISTTISTKHYTDLHNQINNNYLIALAVVIEQFNQYQKANTTQPSPIMYESKRPIPLNEIPVYDNTHIIKKITAQSHYTASQIRQLEKYGCEYEHQPEWQNHYNIIGMRKNAITELTNGNHTHYIQHYQLSPEMTAYCKKHSINSDTLTCFNGDVIQHAIHNEFILLNEHAYNCWNKKKLPSEHKKTLRTVTHLTNAGILFNTTGDTYKAIAIANTCWMLLDCIQAVGEGLVQGTCNMVDDLLHPTQTIKNIIQSSITCGYYLGKTIVEIGEIGYLGLTDSHAMHEKLNNWAFNSSAIYKALKEQSETLKTRDIIKESTVLAIQCYATSKALSGISKIFKQAQKYLVQMSKKPNASSTLTTPEGVIVRIANSASEYIQKTDIKNYKSTITTTKKITSQEAITIAEKLNFTKTNYYSHKQPVFKKGNIYITPDVDAHSGGIWKMANSIENLKNKKTRMGTYDINLNRIGD